MEVRTGCKPRLPHQSDHLAHRNPLTRGDIVLAEVPIHGIEDLACIAEVVADDHRQAVRIFGVVDPGIHTVSGPNDLPRPRGEDRRAIRCGDIDPGVNRALKKNAAVAIIRQGPIDFIGSDRAYEEEVIVRCQRPWNRIKWWAPRGNRRCICG